MSAATDQTSFQNSLAQLQADELQFSALTGPNGAIQTAMNKLETELKTISNPILAIMVILQCLSPYLELQQSQYGEAEKIAADVQNCNNDIHNITNSTGGGTQAVTDVAEDSQTMENLMGYAPAGQTNSYATEAQGIAAALGSTATQSLLTNFQAIRGTIFVGSGGSATDQAYNSAAGQAAAKSGNYAGFMVAGITNPTSGIATWGDLQADMAMPGDPQNATELYHTILTAANTNSSTLTTQTSVADTNLKTLGSQDQQWISLGHDIGEMIMNIIKTSQQHAQSANG